MTRAKHWESPDPQKLLISARRVAEELDVPAWKANELCWALDRRFYAEGQVHYRVTKRSLDDFKRLVDLGLGPSDARDVAAYFRGRGEPGPTGLELTDLKELAYVLRWRRRR